MATAREKRQQRGREQKTAKDTYGAGSPQHLAAIERTKASERVLKADVTERRDAPSSVKAANPQQKAKGNVFAGTNIPLSAIKNKDQRANLQRRLAADIAAGDTRGANDVLFSIAFAAGGNKGQGNPNVGAVQSGVWKLDSGPRWAEQNINSENDEYRMRDERGNLTGEVVRFSDTHGVLKGTPTVASTGRGGTEATGSKLKDAGGNVLSGSALTGGLGQVGSWGGNARARIVEGQPTATPPPAGVRPGAGGGVQGPYTSGGYIPAGAGGYGGGGFLGGGGYPVMGMGTPSGLSYPAAAEAAEGYAGALGFNIGPEGGLVYRPWEARAWQQTGIDPNLWNAPFAGGGLLGGGYGGGQPGGGRPGAVPGAGVGGTGTTAGVNVPTTGGQVIPTTGGGLSLSGLGGLLGSWGRPTIGGGRVQGGNVQSVADIKAQEESGLGVDQFAVNQMALPSLLSGRAALPSASWTAPANPYGTQPGGYTTSAPGAFSNLVANTPIGTGRANYASDFYTPPSAVATVNPSIEPSIAAAMDAHYAGIPSQDTPYGAWGTGWSGRQALVPTATTATNPFDTGTAQIYGAEPIR